MRKAGLTLLWMAVSVVLVAAVSILIAFELYHFVTGILLLAAAGSVGAWLLETSIRWLKCSHETGNRLRLLLATTFVLVLGVELVLRFGFHRYASYPEQNGWFYASLYRSHHPSWFYTFGDADEVRYAKKEFLHSRRVNSLGLCERELSREKRPNEYRVLALGDSFTEGVGASYEATWVQVLERRLRARTPDQLVTTVNAGVSGSDPFFGYVLLREKLVDLQPDLVIVAVNPTDVNDVIVRGGMERFRPDGSTRYARSAPEWEWLYATSYIVRVAVHEVLGYNWLLLKHSEMGPVIETALAEMRSLLLAFQRLADERGFELLVVFHPASFHEVENDLYSNDLGALVDELEGDGRIAFVDLLERYLLSGAMTRETARTFFWPLDGHHNPKGYEAMGEAVARELASSEGAGRREAGPGTAPSAHGAVSDGSSKGP